MKYKEYLEQQTLLETPKGISHLLLTLSESNLFKEQYKGKARQKYAECYHLLKLRTE